MHVSKQARKMAICNGFAASSYSCLSPNILTKNSIINPKSKTFRVASTSSGNDQQWKISKEAGPGCSLSEDFLVEYEKKKEEVRHLLFQKEMNQKDSLVLVDAVQRVGIDHHFYDEIEMILRRQFRATHGRCSNDDLYNASLYFRLLRQQGIYVSSDVFKNFKSSDGKFKEELKGDIRGLMELYEASQLSFNGENIIDEAEEFSRVNLNSCLENMDINDNNWYKEAIKNTLKHPQHKNIARFTARDSLVRGFLRGHKGWETIFTELAKMDFLMGQSIHQEEVVQFSRWWKNLGLAEELPRARNNPGDWYIWSIIILNDPSLSFQRIEFSRAVAFIFIIDDFFDIYTRSDDLTILTEAVNRWEYAAISTLPEYMKNTYKTLLDTTNEIAQNIEKKYGNNPIDSLRAAWGNLCDAFLLEARWYAWKEEPTPEEYLKNGEVTTGIYLLLFHVFFLLGLGGGGPQNIQLNLTSNFISSLGTVARLLNDLDSVKEKRQGIDGSFMDFYMKKEPNITMMEAQQRAMEMISEGWKNINEESFRMNHFSASSFTRGALNIPRMMSLRSTYDHKLKLPLSPVVNP